MNPQQFIERWQPSGAAERANYQLFLTQLCDLLEVPSPEPTRPDDADNAYVFERNVRFQEDDGDSSTGRIDLYKRGAFVLEAKQGSDADTAEDEAAEALQPAAAKTKKRKGTAVRGTKAWDDAMVRARGQADRYARALPVAEGWPPSLTDDEILERLVALNAERAAEEANGLVRWLRPEFQNPSGQASHPSPLPGGPGRGDQKSLLDDEQDESDDAAAPATKRRKGAKQPAPQAKPAAKPKKAAKREWPKGREAQAKAVLAALREGDASVTPQELAKRFSRAPVDTVDELLQALATCAATSTRVEDFKAGG